MSIKKTTVTVKKLKSGSIVTIMTPEQQIADLKQYGKEIRKSKASAIDFLKRAGFIDDKGNLAEPYRA